jgi:DNA helicase IV
MPASSAIPVSGRRPGSGRWPRKGAKGLEFDLVVLVDSAAFAGRFEGAVDRYVAMTRATQELAILTP